MSSRPWMLSIDFGTSNTAAAHTGAVSGVIEPLQLSHNRTTMSSSVFVESPDHIQVGDVAADRAQSNPAAFMPAPKRFVGQGVVNLAGYAMSSSVPVAAVLKSVMKRAVAAHAGELPGELILTHPEAWSQREIQILLDAALSLGVDGSQIKTVSEPRAAARYYARSNSLAAGTRIAVFDFGGGTLDIAVLEANAENDFTVVAAGGDNGIGGKSFDSLIRRWVDEQLEGRNPDLLDYLRGAAPTDVRQALEESIRSAKELLSEAPSATITVSGGGYRESLHFTRDEFEELIAPAMDNAVALTRNTLSAAGISDPGQLAALYLTGGSSRIPLVHERLKDLGPIATLDDPKTVVAQGALAAWVPRPGHSQVRTYGSPLGAAVQAPFAGASTFPVSGSPGAPPQIPSVATAGAALKKPWVIGSVAAAGLVVALVVGVVVWGGGENEPVSTVAAVETVEPEQDAGSGMPTTVEEAIKALPAPLARESSRENCKDRGETDDGGRKIECTYKTNDPLFEGLLRDKARQTIPITLSFDIESAKVVVLRHREGGGFLLDREIREFVEDADRQAVGEIEGRLDENGVVDSRGFWLQYANYVSGLNVTVPGLNSVDSGKEFLRRAGLIVR